MIKKIVISKIIIILILLVSVLFIKCKKENNNGQIPNVYVNFIIYLSDPEYIALTPVGGSLKVEGGVKGIIIHKINFDEFVALECVSSYKPEELCTVEIDTTGIYAVDTCSLSKFSLHDGSVVNGPAVMPLKRYNAIFDNTNNSLHIFN